MLAKIGANVYRFIIASTLVVLIGGVMYFGYDLVSTRLALEHARAELDITRERLDEVRADFDSLRTVYNQAVSKTAVTELVVDDKTVCIHIRTADGQEQVINTNLDVTRPIHVDYVVRDDRLWIRRVYDDMTPPHLGQAINPKIVDIDWDDPKLAHGVTIYRKLTPGRWVVTVTGDGSLGLTHRDDGVPALLSPPPPVREYSPIDKAVDAQVGEVGTLDLLGRLFGSRE